MFQIDKKNVNTRSRIKIFSVHNISFFNISKKPSDIKKASCFASSSRHVKFLKKNAGQRAENP